jgi:diguanylate cyclase (GGDEF)-like protein
VETTEGLAKRLLSLPRGWGEGTIVAASMGLSLLATVLSFGVFNVPNTRWAPTLAIALGVPALVATPVAIILMRLLRALDEARHEAHRLAGIDMMTGLLNRRRWAEQAERELQRARHAHSPLAVLLLDVDNFKQVNDRHGHAAGDLVLKAVAQVCTQTLRPGDVLARWGGEEFVALLPGTSPEGALRAAERVCAALAGRSVSTGLARLHVTASIGVSDANDAGYDLYSLVGLADQAMYGAKKAGKNRALAAAQRRAGACAEPKIEPEAVL